MDGYSNSKDLYPLNRAETCPNPKAGTTIAIVLPILAAVGILSFVIPKFIRNCMDGSPPVIYGDGDQVRSYCYSSDTAWATIEALLSEEADGEIMNIGNSENRTSLSSLANLIIRACGKQETLKPEYQRQFSKTDRSLDREIFERYCNISKAKGLLGFMPLVSLQEGIQKVLEHGVILPKWGSTDIAYTLDEWF